MILPSPGQAVASLRTCAFGIRCQYHFGKILCWSSCTPMIMSGLGRTRSSAQILEVTLRQAAQMAIVRHKIICNAKRVITTFQAPLGRKENRSRCRV